jgi:hypothetical protein
MLKIVLVYSPHNSQNRLKYKSDHVTFMLKSLHWLSASFKIDPELMSWPQPWLFFQPHVLPHFLPRFQTLGMLLPQGLCTPCLFVVKYCSPRYSWASLFHFLHVTTQMFPFERGLPASGSSDPHLQS